jgi:hypothetical protein
MGVDLRGDLRGRGVARSRSCGRGLARTRMAAGATAKKKGDHDGRRLSPNCQGGRLGEDSTRSLDPGTAEGC